MEIEHVNLRKACEMQKHQMQEQEAQLVSVEGQFADFKAEADERLRSVREEAAEEAASAQKAMASAQDEFDKERIKLKEKLHDVTSNEINLINKIKSLEADAAYNRAEVEKSISREREGAEISAKLKYRIDVLETELAKALKVL